MLFIWYYLFFEFIGGVIWYSLWLVRKVPVLNWFRLKLDYLGTVFHEVCHYLVMHILGMKVKDSQLFIWKQKNGYNGSVDFTPDGPIPLFKATCVALAPGLLGTLTITQLLLWWHTQYPSLILRIIVFSIVMLILLAITPSWADLSQIWKSLKNAPVTALKQLLFSGVAIGMMFIYWNWFQCWCPLPLPWFEIVVFLLLFGTFELLGASLNWVLRYTTRVQWSRPNEFTNWSALIRLCKWSNTDRGTIASILLLMSPKTRMQMRWLRRFFHRFNKSTGDPMAEPIVNVKIHETLFYHESPLLNALTALQIKVSIHDGDIDVVEITPSVGLFRLCINELDSETLSDFIERIKRFHKHYSQQIIIAEGYGNEDRSIDPLLIAGFMILIVQQEKVGITPTRDVADTALCIRSMAVREQIKDRAPTMGRPKSHFATIKDAQLFLVEGLINCGPKKAEILLDHCSTPAELFTVFFEDPSLITNINGFGDRFLDDNQQLLAANFVEPKNNNEN